MHKLMYDLPVVFYFMTAEHMVLICVFKYNHCYGTTCVCVILETQVKG